MSKTIIDILISKGALDANSSTAILEEAQAKNILLEDILYQRGTTEKEVAEAKSELTGYPIKYMQDEPVAFEILKEIPEESARYYKMAPLGKNEGYLDVGMLYPEDLSAREALKFIATKANIPIRVFIIIPSDFHKILEGYKGLSGEVNKALSEFKKEYPGEEEEVKAVKPESTNIMDEAPITKMVSVILRHPL